jgi:hypothetical protein
MATTTYVPGASGSFLLFAKWPTRDAAGNPRSRAPGRSSWQSWEAQLHRWGLCPNKIIDPDEDGRLWLVELADACHTKITRSIRGPTSLQRDAIPGFRIHVWPANIATTKARVRDGITEGPLFWLTFNDARRLWADRYMRVVPFVECITVRGFAA